MNALDQVNVYLQRLEQRVRMFAFSKGAAATAAAALLLTLLLAFLANAFSFSNASVAAARIVLFLLLALAATFGLVIPLLRLNRRRAARLAESRFADFQQRLLTVAESPAPRGLFDELIAQDALPIVRAHPPAQLAPAPGIAAMLGSTGVAVAVLLWLILAAPGYLGYGSALLWAGVPPGGGGPLYQVVVSPGNLSVRRHADQMITAQLLGFTSSQARLFAQYRGTSKWEPIAMQPRPGSSAFQFLFGGLPETVDYYVAAGSIRTPTYTLRVVDPPAVTHIRVQYHFPGWSGLKDETVDPGGDLRALVETVAGVFVETDRPLSQGALILDNGTEIPLAPQNGNWAMARVPITQDGTYHIAAVDSGDRVRLSEDYFIEAQKDSPPTVRVTRPSRDARANPVEEVPVEVVASDEFGLRDLALHYSINGGPEKTVPLMASKGRAMLSLEDYKLIPGDIVSFYASARGPRLETKSDMFFVQAEPFEREYSQSQSTGAAAAPGEEQISERQKEIVTATWNQLKNAAKNPEGLAEEARFLASVQSKLSEQASSLAERMRTRELTAANQEFQSFSKDMDNAAEAMRAASAQLKNRKWREALSPEQIALQNLLRAEATFRQIQVAFGKQSGGAGSGGMGRDLANLFDLELDTEKNQYETGQQQASANKQAKELDETLQKLQELARRQQELAEQQKKQSPLEQRWQQEMLRREAEQLRQRMEEQSQSQQGQQGQQGQSGQPGQQGQQGPQSSALQRLREATREMSQAASQPNAEKQRQAAEHLNQARDALQAQQAQQAKTDLEQMSRQSAQLAQRQKESSSRLLHAFGGDAPLNQAQASAQGARLAVEKEQLARDLKRLEQQMNEAARTLRAGSPDASHKLNEALGDMQQNELGLRLRKQAEFLRQGAGAAVWTREAPISNGLDKLNQQIQQARGMTSQNAQPGESAKAKLESALSQLEQLHEQLEQSARTGKSPGRGALGDLGRLPQSLGGAPEFAGDLRQLRRDTQALTGPASDALVAQRIRASLLPEIEHLELLLRREIGAGSVRTQGGEAVPDGYSDAVAEYFRKLSQAK